MRRGRLWRALLVVLVSAGALSGCYYDPYTGGYYPYPPYPYPYHPPYPYPAPPPPANPAIGIPPALNAPVQQTPLPPPAQ
jgi:hypothetical protein